MLDLQKNLRLLTIQYELAMLIGKSLDVTQMLNLFLPKALLYLDCIHAHIWLINRRTKKEEYLLSYPKLQPGKHQLIELSLKDDEVKTKGFKHIIKEDRNQHSYIFNLQSVGHIILDTKKVPLADNVIQALIPVFNRLGTACEACIQYSMTEESYEDIFLHSPICLIEADCRKLQEYIIDLDLKDITNFEHYIFQHPNIIKKSNSLITIKRVNQTGLDFFGVESSQEFHHQFFNFFAKDSNTLLTTIFLNIANGRKYFDTESIVYTIKKKKKFINFYLSTIPDETNSYKKVLISIIDISELKHAERKLDYLAKHDYLTQLPNRFMFHQALEHNINRADRTKKSLAVMYLDLDYFKTINDKYGHETGDELLVLASQRIRDNIRKDDFVARLGGDEFSVILNGLSSDESATNVSQKMLDAFKVPFIIYGKEINITISIGVALYPEKNTTKEDILKHADIALYSAKNSGRNKFCFYSLDAWEFQSRKYNMEISLRKALENHEFCVEFQPIYSLTNNRIIAIEALLRWQNTALGSLQPSQFIPAAESNNKIIEIDEWQMKEAIRCYSQWLHEGLGS